MAGGVIASGVVAVYVIATESEQTAADKGVW